MKRLLVLAMVVSFLFASVVMPARAAFDQPAPPAGALALALRMLTQFRQLAASHPQSLTDFRFANAGELAKLTLGNPIQVFDLPNAAVQQPPATLSTALEPLGWFFPMMTGATYHGFLYVGDLGGNRWRDDGTFSGSLAQDLAIGLEQRLPAALAQAHRTEAGPAQTFQVGTTWFILTPTDQGAMILPLGDFPPYWVGGTLYPASTLTHQFSHLLAAESAAQSSLPGPHSLPTSWQGLVLIWILPLLPVAILLVPFIWFVRRQRRRERLDRADPSSQPLSTLWESDRP